MLQKAVRWNVNFIVKALNITDKYEIDRIRYGVETLLGESTKTVIIFILSLFSGRTIDFLIVSSMMILFRSKIGGTHAKSFTGCLIRTLVLFYILYFLGDLTVNMPLWIQVVITVLIGAVLSTVKYKTKLDDSGKDETMNKKLRIQLIIVATLSIAICKIFYSKAIGLLLVTLSYIILDYIYMKRSVVK